MNTYMKFILLEQIQLKRKDMYSIAKHYGYTHPRVVTCSQELDTLLNRYQGVPMQNCS